jgi:hypothetical protein
MMNTISKIGVSGALAMFLIAPVYAAKQTIGDEALDGITGKADNVATIQGNSTLTVGMSSSNGSVQVGYYQWNDDHSADASDHKGANDQSGANSGVQQNVNSTVNTLLWGAGAQVSTVNTAAIGESQDVESWGTMYLGGF